MCVVILSKLDTPLKNDVKNFFMGAFIGCFVSLFTDFKNVEYICIVLAYPFF